MDRNVYLYYSLNFSKQSVKNYKSGTKSISIVKVPEHISFKLMYNLTDIDGFIFPNEVKYIIFKKFNSVEYNFIYNMLYPEPNLVVALCNIEHHNEAVRQMSIAIIKQRAKPGNFDFWLNNPGSDVVRYLNINHPQII